MKSLFQAIKDWFCGLFAEKKSSYYYRLSEDTCEPEQVSFTQQPEPDVPLFTAEELQEMKKADLLDLALDSGIHGVSKKDTKAVLIEKIASHYEIQK